MVGDGAVNDATAPISFIKPRCFRNVHDFSGKQIMHAAAIPRFLPIGLLPIALLPSDFGLSDFGLSGRYICQSDFCLSSRIRHLPIRLEKWQGLSSHKPGFFCALFGRLTEDFSSGSLSYFLKIAWVISKPWVIWKNINWRWLFSI